MRSSSLSWYTYKMSHSTYEMGYVTNIPEQHPLQDARLATTRRSTQTVDHSTDSKQAALPRRHCPLFHQCPGTHWRGPARNRGCLAAFLSGKLTQIYPPSFLESGAMILRWLPVCVCKRERESGSERERERVCVRLGAYVCVCVF